MYKQSKARIALQWSMYLDAATQSGKCPGAEPSAPAPVKINLQDNPINICEESAYELSLFLSSDTENPLPDPTLITTYIVEIFHPPSSRT
jgi:hypothetical protein